MTNPETRQPRDPALERYQLLKRSPKPSREQQLSAAVAVLQRAERQLEHFALSRLGLAWQQRWCEASTRITSSTAAALPAWCTTRRTVLSVS